MSFNLNKLVQPECGGPNPLVRAAQRITSSRPMMLPANRNGVPAYVPTNHPSQLDYVKEFADQQVSMAGTSNATLAHSMTINQQQLQNLSIQQSQRPLASFSNYAHQAHNTHHPHHPHHPLLAHTNPMLGAAAATNHTYHPALDSQVSGADQLEAKYRSDMMSRNEDRGKLHDMEFWEGMAQTYMGPTTYSSIARARVANKEQLLGEGEVGATQGQRTIVVSVQKEKEEENGTSQARQGPKARAAKLVEEESKESLLGEESPLELPGEIFEGYFDQSEYQFDERNPLKGKFDDPFQEGLRRLEAGDIPSAALLFEEAVQVKPDNALAWRYLGTTQAQNEKDVSAIAALKKCLDLDPTDLQALLSISVSMVNEYQKAGAYRHLLLWLQNNHRYKNISVNMAEFEQLPVERFQLLDADDANHNNQWDYVRVRFFEAARMSPNNPDPDVQTALGLLYSSLSDYNKAIDCFRSALSVRPEDSSMWNRLGATLANSNRNEEAVVAYRRALELSPGFLRSRYNLAVSLVQLNCYDAAAKQLVQILNIQTAGVGGRTADVPRARVVTSSSIWNTLRTTVTLMNRPDLYPIVDGRNLAECNAKLFSNQAATVTSGAAETSAVA